MSNNIQFNPNTILVCFVWFFVGMLASFVAINQMIVKPHTDKANQVVNTVLQDARKLEQYGAMTMVTQCKELGYAFVASDDNKGYVIDCNENSIQTIAGDQFAHINGKYKEFSSKLSDRPLVSPKLNKD